MPIHDYCEGFGSVSAKTEDRFKGPLPFTGNSCWMGRCVGAGDSRIINKKDMRVKSKPTQNCLTGYSANLNTQPSIIANVEKNHQALAIPAQLFINTLPKFSFSSLSCWGLQFSGSKTNKKKSAFYRCIDMGRHRCTDKPRVIFSLPRNNLGSEA